MKQITLAFAMILAMQLWAAFPEYIASFSTNCDQWTSAGLAEYTDVGRRVGSGSLMLEISTKNAKETLPAWTSPVINLKKEAAILSFWTADNYLKLQDFSYSASVAVTECADDGTLQKEIAREYTEWDTTLVSPYMWGLRTEQALIWKYHEIPIPPGHENIRLTFALRAAMVSGRCYLSDVQVTPGTAERTSDTPSPLSAKTRSGWLSCPAPGGIFYSGDPMRYDFLCKLTKEKLDRVHALRIRLTLRDFYRNLLCEETLLPHSAKPLEDASFYEGPFARKNGITRENHCCFRVPLLQPKMMEQGILHLLTAECLDTDGTVLCADTALYGVVAPAVIPSNPEKSYFFTRDQGMTYYDSASKQGQSSREQEFTQKMHSFRCADLSLSYKWREYQPIYPGAITIKNPLPKFPLQLYMPNVEQVLQPHMIPLGAQQPLAKPSFYAGRMDRPQVDYNPEAYADFIVEYVRQNRASITHVVPSGLERPYSKRVTFLQKRVYEKLKALDPKLKIGFTINSISLKDFADNHLYDYADFLNLHMYGSAVDFNYEDSAIPYKEFYQKTLKRKIPEFTLTEGAMRLPLSHLNYAFGTLRGIWSLLSNRFVGIYYYNQRNSKPIEDPDLTDTVTSDPFSSGYDSYRFVQLVNRPVFSPELRMEQRHAKKRWADNDGTCAGVSIMPTVATMTYYNMIRDFDFLPFQRVRLTGNAQFYYFGNKERTVIGINPLDSTPEQAYLVKCSEKYIVRDLLGRTTEITPKDGVSYIQPGKYPLTLLFNKPAVPSFVPMQEATLLLDNAVAGDKLRWNTPQIAADLLTEAGNWDLQLEGEEGVHRTFNVSDGTSDKTIRTTCSMGLPSTCTLGNREVRAFLLQNGKIRGLWQGSFVMERPVAFSLKPSPVIKELPGGRTAHCITLHIRNDSSVEQKGYALFEDKWFCFGTRPNTVRQDFSVKPKKQKDILIPVGPYGITATFNEIISLKVHLSTGETETVSGRIHFRFVPPCLRPPDIDGDLSDWPINELTHVPVERIRLADVNALPARNEMANGQCYAMYHGDTLYLAFIVKDTTPVSRYMDVNFWMDDNILLNLYPWRTPDSERLNPGYYRSHFGFYRDGTLHQYWESKYAPDGAPKNADDIRKACRRTADGYVYEIACPAASIHPLKIKPDSGFRLSWCIFDTLEDIQVLYFTGQLSFFGGAAVNYNTNPKLWYEFLFTSELIGGSKK